MNGCVRLYAFFCVRTFLEKVLIGCKKEGCEVWHGILIIRASVIVHFSDILMTVVKITSGFPGIWIIRLFG